MSGSDPEQPPPTHQPSGQNPYGAPPPYQPPHGQYSFAPQAPVHPSATTALVLSLVALVGIMLCGGLTLVLSPFAWVIGGRAVKQIDANPGAYSGRESANAGRIMGIVGTALLVLWVIAAIAFIAFIVGATNDTTTFGSGGFLGGRMVR